MDRGYSLDDIGSRISWWDVKCLLMHIRPESAIGRHRNPDAAYWNLTNQLLALSADLLAGANWQRAGGKQKDKPTPIPRPGVDNGVKKTQHKPKAGAMPLSQVRKQLEARRSRAQRAKTGGD